MRREFTKPRGIRVVILTAGPVTVAVSTTLCLFFLFFPYFRFFRELIIPAVLYLWAAVAYWLGYKDTNEADKLATMAASTSIYLIAIPFYGWIILEPYDTTLGLFILLAIMTGVLELLRWRRRISYVGLGGVLIALALSWLRGRILGPVILNLIPALMLYQSLVLIAVSLPAELYEGGAGDPVKAPETEPPTPQN